MISLLRKKPRLVELIPEGYIDIHSHILPGIDDGAKNVEDSIALLAEMAALGFSECIPTPHIMSNIWDNSRESIQGAYLQTVEKLPSSIGIKLPRFSSEYMMDELLIDRMNKEPLLAFANNIVLVEMSYLNPSADLKNILFQLQMKGYKPLLAHPERYLFYHNSKEYYFRLKELGCLFQLNLLSAVGYYGEPVTKIADYLLSNDLIDFVGSDIHHLKHIEAFHQRIKIKSERQLVDAMNKNTALKQFV